MAAGVQTPAAFRTSEMGDCRRTPGTHTEPLFRFMKITNKMQLCRIIYCFLLALHVSSDIFAHHQERLNFMYNFWYYSHVSVPAGIEAGYSAWQRHMRIIPEAVHRV
jgi:hypothetical protein